MCLMLPFGVVCTVHLLLYRNRLSGVTCYRTCRNIFRRCYFIVHIRYEKNRGEWNDPNNIQNNVIGLIGLIGLVGLV
jgi:hypothetical protein